MVRNGTCCVWFKHVSSHVNVTSKGVARHLLEATYKGALVGWLGLGLSDGGRKFSLGLYWVSVSSPVGQMRPGFSTPNSTPKCSLVSEFRMGGGLSCLVLGVLTEDGWAL